MRKEYTKIRKIESSMIEIDKVTDIAYKAVVSVHALGMDFVGEVVKLDEDSVTIEVFGSTERFSKDDIVVSFEEKPLEIPLDESILGRSFNGIGQPIDNGGQIYSDKTYSVEGLPLNPVAREYPRDFIQTGISSIDTLTTLIRGQKLPIFSASGLSHNEIAGQIVRQAKLKSDENFCFVFAAMGIKKDEAMFFEDAFNKAGVRDKVVMYENLADSPIMERLIAPKCALTAAEYLAFEKGYHVLCIITDMTSYSEALREVSSIRGEVPSRKGYPGYLYSDLASLYERAGMIKGLKGSVTLLPILTMPNDDITHPVADLTGFITEGQIVIDRSLANKGIYPPINILPSLSRLMKDGIGEGYTRADHEDLMNQLYESYSKVIDVRNISQIVGEDDISDVDKKYLKFGEEFENRFLSQDINENRDLDESLDLGWQILKILPRTELHRVSKENLDKFIGSEDASK
ncbi:MAG: V-type ATP synthase subunit B [Anaerococcus sp.]|nr:V-type ATP synthase subunit B [Anaerococcus sp.]